MEGKLSRVRTSLLLFFVVAPIIACVLLSKSLVIGFAVSLVSVTSLILGLGFNIKNLLDIIKASILECKNIIVLIFLIGATVSVWIASGVVPTLIYYGLDLLKDSNFLLMTFIIVLICSCFIGSAVATISTIGIAIIGIGISFKIPVEVLLGVIVSGAYIADKISPLSGLLNLILNSVGSSYRKTTRSMLRTLIPTLIICSLIYYKMGLKYMGASSGAEILNLQEMLNNTFKISPLLIIIPVLVVVFSLLGLGAIRSIGIGCLIGSFTSAFYQGANINEALRWIVFGYKITSPYDYINKLLFSGGLISMIEVILIVMGAVSLGGLLEKTGILRHVLNDFISRNITKNSLIIKTAISSMLLTVFTCDQTLGIVIPSRLFKENYDRLKIKREVLGRTISDSGTIIAPLMPWNVNAIIIASVTGINSGYGLFSILCYIFPLVTIVVSIIENSISNNRAIKKEKNISAC